MKKFFALLFVCAGLTAMAGVPQINKADIAKATKGQMVMKANTFTQEMTAPVMHQMTGAKAPAASKLINAMRPSVVNNKTVRKSAPRRLSNADIVNEDKYLDFRYVWTVNDEGTDFEWSYYHVRGGEGVKFQEQEGTLYCVGLFWDDDPESPAFGSGWWLDLNIDYATGVIELPTGYSLLDTAITGTYNSSVGYRIDKEIYRMLVDANYMFEGAEEPSSVYGTLLEDGSMEFDSENPYVYAGYNVLKYYKRTGSAWTGYTYTLDHVDTTYFQEIFSGTQFLVANGTHDYDYLNNGAVAGHKTDSIFLFQSDYNTVNVFNMFGDGMPYSVINVNADGVATYPTDWPTGECGNYLRNMYQDYYGSSYDFSYMHYTWPYAMDEEYNVTEDTVIIGTVTPEVITLPRVHTEMGPIYASNDTQHTNAYALVSYLINNEIKFMDGTLFVLEEPIVALRGDVDRDGQVKISDVTMLINHLLSGDFDDADDFSGDNADCDQNGEIKIGDVTTLINYLLTGEWPAD